MIWLRAAVLGLRIMRAQRKIPLCDEAARQVRTAFTARFDEVAASCAQFGCDALWAADYMSHVLSNQSEAAWWQENAPSLTKPWFIWRYGAEHGLLEAEETPRKAPIILQPEGRERIGHAEIFIERAVRHSDQGRILICCAPETDVLRPLGYAEREGRYARRVDECAGGIMSRAAEAGEALLAAGYTLTLEEDAVRRLILSGDYEKEKRYWIRETERSDVLRLTYPRDSALHRYICMAGGRWNGKYVEMPIIYADRLEDLIRLYGFSMTEEAARRIETWHQALSTATVYRPRVRRRDDQPNPRDMFKQMLARDIVVPDDLKDEDD